MEKAMKKIILLSGVLCLLSFSASAQIFGGYPQDAEWNRRHSDYEYWNRIHREHDSKGERAREAAGDNGHHYAYGKDHPKHHGKGYLKNHPKRHGKNNDKDHNDRWNNDRWDNDRRDNDRRDNDRWDNNRGDNDYDKHRNNNR